MNSKVVGIVLLVLGVVVAVLAAAADKIGIGNPSEFGVRQMVGLVVGAIVTLAGIVFLVRKPAPSK